jgi:hypothetical protein
VRPGFLPSSAPDVERLRLHEPARDGTRDGRNQGIIQTCARADPGVKAMIVSVTPMIGPPRDQVSAIAGHEAGSLSSIDLNHFPSRLDF